MALLKCKMCGDSLSFSEEQNYCTCRSCGTTSTVPKGDDRQRVRSYNRANTLRRNNQFDKALSIYEKLIEEDETDPEAHWCAVLCRFGIEYVEDPATEEQMPTCHRASYDNILQDIDYLAAVDLSLDNYSRDLYQSEATLISEIMQEVLAISQNEAPYDVFICYKESDELNNRTIDSTLAEDIYQLLIDKHYKVFFARITLEDKLGRAYEPYIFAALNSAKAMIIVGTTPEYYDAVWVKNEWSRFLALMKKDKSKILIPCYRDMNPRDMPKELAMLQSQDMNKIGFMQDLVRGVEKIVPNKRKHKSSSENGNIDSLIKRIELFLEDSAWDEALSYCEKVLDLDAECGIAYAYRICTNHKCNNLQNLAGLRGEIRNSNDYKKAIRFSEGAGKNELIKYAETIFGNQQEFDRKQGEKEKNNCILVMESADFTENPETIRQAFNSIETAVHIYNDEKLRGYKNCDKELEECLVLKNILEEKILIQRGVAEKNNCIQAMESAEYNDNLDIIRDAVSCIRSAIDIYTDEKLKSCKNYEKELEECLDLEEKIKTDEEKELKRLYLVAFDAKNNKDFKTAKEIFVKLERYKDSWDQQEEIVLEQNRIVNMYKKAVEAESKDDYLLAISLLDSIKTDLRKVNLAENALDESVYLKEVQKCSEKIYQEGRRLVNQKHGIKSATAEEVEEGIALLEKIPDYPPAKEEIKKQKAIISHHARMKKENIDRNYNEGIQAKENGDYDLACKCFIKNADDSESLDQVRECKQSQIKLTATEMSELENQLPKIEKTEKVVSFAIIMFFLSFLLGFWLLFKGSWDLFWSNMVFGFLMFWFVATIGKMSTKQATDKIQEYQQTIEDLKKEIKALDKKEA